MQEYLALSQQQACWLQQLCLERQVSELLAPLCCSRSISPDDVNHFPYCVAEIKLQVQDVPPWLLGVVQSGGVSCSYARTCRHLAAMCKAWSW